MELGGEKIFYAQLHKTYEFTNTGLLDVVVWFILALLMKSLKVYLIDKRATLS